LAEAGATPGPGRWVTAARSARPGGPGAMNRSLTPSGRDHRAGAHRESLSGGGDPTPDGPAANPRPSPPGRAQTGAVTPPARHDLEAAMTLHALTTEHTDD